MKIKFSSYRRKANNKKEDMKISNFDMILAILCNGRMTKEHPEHLYTLHCHILLLRAILDYFQ